MTSTDEQVEAGQAVYTKRLLRVYDPLVLGISSRYVWRCPSARIQSLYRRHVSCSHLDVGVGTGYFLDRCRFPSDRPRVALMDLNPTALEYAASRISRYRPEIYRQNVLEPIRVEIPKFDSVGINYLLHCLPGPIREKAVALDHLKTLMNPGAVLFGSTILQGGVSRGWAARRLMGLYNRKGIFSNTEDDLDGLWEVLRQRFDQVSVDVIGSVALFSGRV